MIIQLHKAKPRVEELDFLKCVFITLMIAFHLVYIGNTYPVAKQYVYTFHMPGFLLVSGYLFNVRKSWSALGKTLLWIFIPYAIMESSYTLMASLLPIREHINHLTPAILLDHIFLHPIGPYWYLHTLILCGLSYYLAFKTPSGRVIKTSGTDTINVDLKPREGSKKGKIASFINTLNQPQQIWIGRTILLTLFLWLLSHGCQLLSVANAAYFLGGVIIRQGVGDFRKSFPTQWWIIILLIIISLDVNNYNRASYGGVCIVYLVISTLLWLYHLRIPTQLRRIMLFVGRNTFPLLLFSPIFTMLAKYYQNLLIKIEPTGMLFLLISVLFAITGSFAITWVMDKIGLSRLFFGQKTFLK